MKKFGAILLVFILLSSSVSVALAGPGNGGDPPPLFTPPPVIDPTGMSVDLGVDLDCFVVTSE